MSLDNLLNREAGYSGQHQNIQLQMYEKNLQNQKVSSSIFSNTAQKQRYGESAQRDEDPKQSKTRIFKYPYLVERSNEKFREDNKSQRSLERQVAQTHHRRKIFEPKSTIESQMKHSTMSADLAYRNQPRNLFESNPVRQKIKNSRNKSSSNNRAQQIPIAQPLQTHNSVSFKYFSPQDQYIKSTSSHLPVLRPPTIQKPSKVQTNLPQPFVGYVQRNIPMGYYSVPVENHRAAALVGNSNIIRPQLQSYPPPHPIVINQQVPIINPVSRPVLVEDYQYKTHVSDRFKPVRITTNSITLPQNKPVPDKPQPMPVNNNQISWVTPQPQHYQNHPHQSTNQFHAHKPQSFVQHKHEQPPKSLQAAQHTVNRNMYQTYKIGQRFKNHNFLAVPANRHSPKKAKQQKNHQIPSISSFVSGNNGQEQDSVDLHEVQQLENLFQAGDRYADRFYDMDFKETKKQENFYSDHHKNNKQAEKQSKNVLPQETLSLKKTSSERKEYQKQAISRKNSITSIAMEKESIKKLESEKDQKISHQYLPKRQNLMTGLIAQGKLFTTVLIGIGVLLVIIQILR